MILITVPHAKPHKNVERDAVGLPLEDVAHYCDWISEYAARALHARLPNSVLVVGDTNRRIFDLNRRESRKTDFRKNVQKILESGNISLIIDMHSADKNFFGNHEVTIICQDARAWGDYQIAAWTKGKAHLRTPNFLTPYEYTLIDELKKDGFSPNIACAWPWTLDIIEHARTMDVPGVLLEMNEVLLTTPESIDAVADSIAKWATRIE